MYIYILQGHRRVIRYLEDHRLVVRSIDGLRTSKDGGCLSCSRWTIEEKMGQAILLDKPLKHRDDGVLRDQRVHGFWSIFLNPAYNHWVSDRISAAATGLATTPGQAWFIDGPLSGHRVWSGGGHHGCRGVSQCLLAPSAFGYRVSPQMAPKRISILSVLKPSTVIRLVISGLEYYSRIILVDRRQFRFGGTWKVILRKRKYLMVRHGLGTYQGGAMLP